MKVAGGENGLRLKRTRLPLSPPVIMGILNVTPDSFSDGGKFMSISRAVGHARRMLEAGAAIIDVGGESTRPGAAPVPVEEELARTVPVVRALVEELGATVSIDTSKPEVMRAAVEAGAELINDVNALRAPGALETAAESGAAVCLMHMQGTPRDMQHDPRYRDVVTEVRDFLQERAEAALEAGISAESIVLDPGFGFGKRLEHNLALFRRLSDLAALGYPLLVGVSRKSMVGALTGQDDPRRRVYGSVALALLAVQRGASILRVHDVAATREVLACWEAIEGQEGGARA